MNPNSHPDSALDEQAATWAARLDGDILEASERAALDAWLAKSPAHRAALADYCQFSADLEEQLPILVSTGAVKMPATAPAASRRRWWSLPRFASLTFAAAAALAVATWIAHPDEPIENVSTAVAQRSSHTLADGTRVELNAHTSLRFENTPTSRLVRFAGGEALFAVAKDPARPFYVQTPAGAVRVTGTTFNVRNHASGPTTLEVTVVEGSVEVRPIDPAGATGQPPYSLSAGDQLSAGAGGVQVRPLPPETIAQAIAWRDGLVVCRDTPLHDVAARFSRYHARRITVDPAIADEKIGGSFSLDDLPAFANALELALPVKVTKDPSGVWSIARIPGR